MKTKKKKFDSVNMMRDIRSKLSERDLKNTDLEKRDLEKIRLKYGILKSQSKKTVST